jgi:hypothetical protein
MKKRLLILIVLTALTVPVNSEDIKFHNINQIFGISMRETASVCKDDNGFIWTSPKTGILRIMGNDYRVYQLPFKKFNVINVSRWIYRKSDRIVCNFGK